MQKFPNILNHQKIKEKSQMRAKKGLKVFVCGALRQPKHINYINFKSEYKENVCPKSKKCHGQFPNALFLSNMAFIILYA